LFWTLSIYTACWRPLISSASIKCVGLLWVRSESFTSFSLRRAKVPCVELSFPGAKVRGNESSCYPSHQIYSSKTQQKLMFTNKYNSWHCEHV